MTDFHDELRDALGRKAAEAGTDHRIPEGTLRRARRHRAATAAVTGVVTLGVLFGGFIGVRAAMDLAGGGEVRPVPIGPPQVGPSPTTSPEPPVRGPGIRCGKTQGGSDAVFPDFVDVEFPPVRGPVDLVTFRFVPMGGQSEAPRYFISFVDQLTTDGEGAPVHVRGSAFLAVSFMARGVDLSGGEVTPIYTGPKELVVDVEGELVRELEQTGDFEGMVSWGIGLSEKACYTVDAGPDHLTITFVRS